MPTDYQTPNGKVRHCAPCKYHHCVNSVRAMVFGDKAKYECRHPDAFVPLRPDVPPNIKIRIGKKRPREIGLTEWRPAWCPLNRKAVSNN